MILSQGNMSTLFWWCVGVQDPLLLSRTQAFMSRTSGLHFIHNQSSRGDRSSVGRGAPLLIGRSDLPLPQFACWSFLKIFTQKPRLHQMMCHLYVFDKRYVSRKCCINVCVTNNAQQDKVWMLCVTGIVIDMNSGLWAMLLITGSSVVTQASRFLGTCREADFGSKFTEPCNNYGK